MAVERLLNTADQVILTGKSETGKKIIEANGSLWVIESYGTPKCFGEDVQGYLGKSIDTGNLQWFREEGDLDFEYEYYNTLRSTENGSQQSRKHT